ncbi:hypothetical protein ABH942_001681 [Flavobacterium sp. 28YEA47A]|uniref:peptide-N-glycosidase F-related protein n=1 Tax=Flavobacterium sp. 28YEA47A TaxID=3156276 RepID=UPI0035157C1F
MRRTLLFLIFGFMTVTGINVQAQNTLTVFEEILFYDGYAGVVNFPTPEGVIRHRNDLYAKKIDGGLSTPYGSNMTIEVIIKASCDNYDRIGNVNLALVPKGLIGYSPDNVQRIELARFITPFMNKNRQPDQVPYTFSANNLSKILNDPGLNAAYDFWMELEVFGVPYAANTQVAGCSGRNDVFYGTLNLISDGTPAASLPTFLLPLNFKKNLNNYNENATDVVGQTVRTINFNIPNAITDAKLYLITSNHGANENGEEYNRRWHYIQFDNVSVLTYRPGEPTCEPYRVYNTQGNGIYGSSPRTPAQWQSFSNWCPGSTIPTREISLGNVAAGQHTFKIEVPDAVFANGEGYFPISVYLQGLGPALDVKKFTPNVYSLLPNPTRNVVTIETDQEVKNYAVFNLLGQEVAKGTGKIIDISKVAQGTYLVQIEFMDNEIATQKIVKL